MHGEEVVVFGLGGGVGVGVAGLGGDEEGDGEFLGFGELVGRVLEGPAVPVLEGGG